MRQRKVGPDGVEYRDLNRNGVMDPYEDPRLPADVRARDLVRRMTVPEKVGEMFQARTEVGPDGSLVEEGALFLKDGVSQAIRQSHIAHFLAIALPTDPRQIARWHNRIQEVAEDTRLGIPVLFSADPLHSKGDNVATGVRAEGFSEWPYSLGLAATGDVDTVRQFGEIAGREYRAVGLRSALHPQIDLATEPRWSRQTGTFGVDAGLSTRFARAYIEGFQRTRSRHDGLTPDSVACMAKHFPGGGPQKDGEDPHFPYGKEQIYPGGMFEYHLEPFLEVIDAGVAAIMPYYGMPIGLTRKGHSIEEVGFAFNKGVITGILRDECGFDGVVCTDFGVINPYIVHGHEISSARAWGVEHLSPAERIAKALDAGCDQFGGESSVELLVQLVESGLVPESRLDESVLRLLCVKFELGLFDDPYVDEDRAGEDVGAPEARQAGFSAQVSSLVLIQDDPAVLPVGLSTRIFVDGADPLAFQPYGEVVSSPAEAELVVVRLDAPYEERSDFVLEPLFHAGSLEFPPDAVTKVAEFAQFAPVVLDVRLDRPAVLTPFVDLASVIIGSFGSGDLALAQGLATPELMVGRLPFQIPRSMETVEDSQADVPDDLKTPLYERGHRATHS